MFKTIFGNSLLSKFGRRYSSSFQDATSFMDQISVFKSVLPELEQQARSLDQNQVEQAMELLLEVRAGLRDITRKVAVGQGHLSEILPSGESLINRLATGAHLSLPENLNLLIEGDIEGLAQYLNFALPNTVDKALPKVRMEQRAILLEAILKANGKYGNEEPERD